MTEPVVSGVTTRSRATRCRRTNRLRRGHRVSVRPQLQPLLLRRWRNPPPDRPLCIARPAIRAPPSWPSPQVHHRSADATHHAANPKAPSNRETVRNTEPPFCPAAHKDVPTCCKPNKAFSRNASFTGFDEARINNPPSDGGHSICRKPATETRRVRWPRAFKIRSKAAAHSSSSEASQISASACRGIVGRAGASASGTAQHAAFQE